MKVKCVLTEEVRDKIMHWTKKAGTHEVSGYAKVQANEGTLKVTHVCLLPQKNGGTSTDIEPEDMAKAMYDLREVPGELTCWWHSHANMDVFWSGTDRTTMGKVAFGGYCLAIVVNTRGQFKAALYMPNAVVRPDMFTDKDLFLDDLELSVDRTINPDVLAAWDAEYDLNVKPKYQYAGGTGWRGESTARKLSKRERKRLKREQSTIPAIPSTGTRTSGWGTAGTDLTGTEEEFDFNAIEPEYRRDWAHCKFCGEYEHSCTCISSDDQDDPCPLCGYTITCDCTERDKALAQRLIDERVERGKHPPAPKASPPSKNGKTGGW